MCAETTCRKRDATLSMPVLISSSDNDDASDASYNGGEVVSWCWWVAVVSMSWTLGPGWQFLTLHNALNAHSNVGSNI